MSTTVPSVYAQLTWAGIELSAQGDRLLFRPRSAATPALRMFMETYKPELLALVSHLRAPLHRAGFWGRCASTLIAQANDSVHRTALREYFEERAAICEFDGNLGTDEAERLAFKQLCRWVAGGANAGARQPSPRSAAS